MSQTLTLDPRLLQRLNLVPDRLHTLCQHWKIETLAVFGSVLRDDFTPQSDIDLLVQFAPEARWTLFDLVDLVDRLSELFERPVDLIERESIEASHNASRRQAILTSCREIYAAPRT